MPAKTSTLTREQQDLIDYLDKFVDYADSSGKKITGFQVSPRDAVKLRAIMRKAKENPRSDYGLKFDLERNTFRGKDIRF